MSRPKKTEWITVNVDGKDFKVLLEHYGKGQIYATPYDQGRPIQAGIWCETVSQARDLSELAIRKYLRDSKMGR